MGRGGETAEHERLADDLEARLVSVSDVASDSASPELLLFHEYFHGDTGKGLGASHQTGWTSLVVQLVLDRARRRAGSRDQS